MASSGDVVGTIKEPRKETYIEWEIENFFTYVPDTVDTVIYSPDFHFANVTWYLRLEPNGYTYDKNEGWFAIYLFLKDNPNNLLIDFTLGIKSDDEKCSDSMEYLFKKEDEFNGFAQLIHRKKLYQRRQKLVPGDKLTVFCRASISSQKKDGINSSSENVRLSSLSEDLKNLFMNEKDYDATINVKEKLFRVHKVIVGSRSPVLSAMFQHDMKESNSNTVNIDDCDPEIFHDFLLFLYSGKTENLSPNTAARLYNLADKYIVQELKQICLDFMEVNMNLKNICEIVILADRYREEQLKKTASEWVVSNMKDVVRTDEWYSLMAENTDLAAELLKEAMPV